MPPWAASAGGEERTLPRAPAVPVKKSVQPDYIVCLEDGKKLKMLKRYLRSRYKLSPGEYRERWNLPPDYPMVAPNYAQKRSDFAKKIGLGKRRRAQAGKEESGLRQAIQLRRATSPSFRAAAITCWLHARRGTRGAMTT